MTFNLTNAGLNVLLRALAGDKIVFTKAQIGNGAEQSASTAEALANPLLDLTITEITVGDSNVTLGTKFSNSTVEAGFRHTETAIWCQNQDDNTKEVLYAYGYQPEATADYISANGDAILETQMDFLVFVGDTENVSAAISESLVYASAAALKEHTENTENPHGVTKSQVGLGNVPNVATNDQTPTYTAAEALTTLTSGETLSTAFGKLAKAVSDLISHIGNKNNPHSVTAAQISAAAASHKHSTSDITSGTLGVARGGTGKSEWTANRLPYPSSASAFSQLAFPTSNGAFLKQNKSGAPFWGSASESGTYAGQGRCGSSAPNSITFSGGTPKAVFIIEKLGARFGILLLDSDMPVGLSVVDDVESLLTVSVSGNTVSWYYPSSESHPANQLDTATANHVYVGIF